MSDKQRLLDRLTKGRTVNRTLFKRLVERMSTPMAQRIIIVVTRLRERGEIAEGVAKTVEEIIVKAKPMVRPKRVTYQTKKILRKPYSPPPSWWRVPL